MTTSVKTTQLNIPNDFQLFQNYPNPFNPSTRIHYSLGQVSQVELSIFNMLGQKVITLVDAVQNVGDYTLFWDATDLNNHSVPSGIYCYQLKTENEISQKKMLLIR